MKQAYIAKRFRESSLSLIATMNGIADDYQRQGFRLSMRQLYYQLVTRNEVANVEREYNRIIRLGTDARMAGLLDWDAIEDRGREFIQRARWLSGAEIMQVAATSYHQDLWRIRDVAYSVSWKSRLIWRTKSNLS